MPAEEGIGRDQGVPVTAYPSPEARGLCGQAPALGVGEPETARPELLSADAILFLERVNDVTRLLVDPARAGHDEELQHVGNRRHTGRAEQRLSAVTTVATRRASSGESARRTASIGFLDSCAYRKPRPPIMYSGISILPAPDGTFIHPRAADPTKLSSSHNRPAPEAVTSAPADVQPTGAPYFQGIPQTPLHTCGLSSPGGLRSTRRASASRHWQRPDPP